MKTRTVFVIVNCMAALLFVGCSELPQKELNAAKAALEEAKGVGAEAYAPSQLQAAQVSLELAAKEISVESRKLPFFRKYDKVVETLNSTTSAAKSAKKAVETAKKRISTEARDLLAQTGMVIDSIDTLLTFAGKKKKDVGTVPAELDSVRICAMIASTALGSGDLFMAKEKAMEAQSRAAATKIVADSLIPLPKKVRTRKR
jgi:hypothetical protein